MCAYLSLETLDIVTKAKLSVVAYTKPAPYKGKGRPCKKGDTIKLKNLFTDKKDEFIEAIECEETKKLILSTLKAIEGYVMCSCIAIGLLQIISITFSKEINKTSFRFLRTKSNVIVSQATVACFLRKNIFLHIAKNSGFIIPQIISKKQLEPCFSNKLKVS